MGITPRTNSGTKRELLPYMVGNSPALPYVVMGSPLVMEYNSRAREYCVIIFVKDHSYFNNPSGHQICLNNLAYHAILMEARVQQWKMTTTRIPIVVNIFDRYKNKKIKWAGIFQIMTQTNDRNTAFVKSHKSTFLTNIQVQFLSKMTKIGPYRPELI